MKIQQLMFSLVVTLVAPFVAAGHFHPQDVSVEVVDGYGQDLPQFNLQGYTKGRHSGTNIKSYLEAKAGQRYAIKVANNSNERVAMVITVDGRNIISGKHSKLKSNEKKYVLGPYQQAVYHGWRTSRNHVNEFYFTHEENSYSAAFGDYSAMGVIAVAVFRDKDRHRYESHHYDDREYSKRSPSSSPAPEAQTRSSNKDARLGTGYGDEQYSRSRKVHFNQERHASAKIFIKYETRETLCKKGVIRCYAQNNRFWHEDNSRRYHSDRSSYAPPPPNRYRYKHGY